MSKITNDGTIPVWHRMLYRCTHMATVGVKGLEKKSQSELSHAHFTLDTVSAAQLGHVACKNPASTLASQRHRVDLTCSYTGQAGTPLKQKLKVVVSGSPIPGFPVMSLQTAIHIT